MKNLPIRIEVFSSPGCDRCGRASELLREITHELASDRIQWREVNVVEELDYAVKLGVLSMPSIAIDGELVFKSQPSMEKLRATLEIRLQTGDA